jgi:hypothetical protein
VNSLRTGDFFFAKVLGRWVGADWRSLYCCRGIGTASGCIFHPVMTSVGLLSTNDPRVHFGSGRESKVASIEIRWPSGIVQTDTNVAADQVLKIEEPPK